MTGRERKIAVLAVATTLLAACGGGQQRAATSTPTNAPAEHPAAGHLRVYRVTLPVSSQGPTTCTVYDSNYGTQIVVDSPTLDVRVQCLVWAANRLGVGFLGGYERSAELPAGERLCSLTDPERKVMASVIDTASLVPGSSQERARGMSLCAGILASGWRRVAPGRGLNRGRPLRS